MKKLILGLLAIGTFTLGAQELPAPSPSSTLNQRVGLTDFTVEYSRPGAKDRTIMGELVAYNKLWRTGANKATAITFNTPVMFSGKKVEAGTYSIFTIPSENQWTFILNKETELWGTDGYKAENDVLRLKLEVSKSAMVETFTIDINHIMDGKAHLVISWGNQQIAVPMAVDVQEKAKSNITEALASAEEDQLWRVNRNAAIYYSRNDIDQKQALMFMETSMELNATSWYSHLVHGEILNRLGEKKDAVKAAKMAMEIGMNESKKEGKEFGYVDMINSSIEEWSAK
jgi:hypothetical protein